MKGLALVIGSGGLGSQIARSISHMQSDLDVVLCGRKNTFTPFWEFDIENNNSLKELKNKIRLHPSNLRLVINATGILHSKELKPEKRLQHISRENLMQSFSINAFAPILLAKNIEEFIPKDSKFNFASLSARVGSIGDNQTGGWYSYRAAKSAQNQLLKSLSIEWSRRFPETIVTILHPGTVDTNLSKPFQRFVPKNKLFTPKMSADYLLNILINQKPENTGKFIAWDGSEIPW